MSETLSFHVRHEVTPDRVLDVLTALEAGEDYSTVTQSDRQLARIRALGLLDTERNAGLSRRGKLVLQVAQKKKGLWADLGHFLHFTLWDGDSPNRNGFSWFYRAFCDYLWNSGEISLAKRSALSVICSEFNNRIEAEAQFEPFLANKSPSLSPDSISGIQHWLEALSPPVIQGQSFARRTFCLPELLLLALGWAFRYEPEPIGVPLLLSRERRELVCRLCLLDPASLDRTLDWMLPRFPAVIESGEKAGFYGRSIRFRKLPTIEDFAS